MLLCGALHAVFAAQPPVAVQMASHAGYARLVLDFGRPTQTTTTRAGTEVTVAFASDSVLVAGPAFDARSVAYLHGIQFRGSSLVLSLAPGVIVRSFAAGNRRVIDVIDAVDAKHTEPTAIAPSRVPVHPGGEARSLPRIDPVITEPAIVASALPDTALAAAAEPVARADPPVAERAVRPALSVAAGAPGAPVLLSFAKETAAAAFRRGRMAIVVFDERRAIDVATLRARPGFAAAEVDLLPEAVTLRVPLPPDADLVIGRAGGDWSIDLHARPGGSGSGGATAALEDGGHSAIPAPPPTMAARIEAGRLHLIGPRGGNVVAILDPVTGDNLLVGTATELGTHVDAGRRFAQFALLPTELGVVVDPVSDQVALRSQTDGYTIESGKPGGSLSLQPAAFDAAQADAARFTRSFDLPDEPASALLRRLHAQIADAAATPARSRLAYRRAVAQTMLAMGMGAEAQGVLEAATDDDPRALTDPAAQTLAAAAALVAGRLDQTGMLAAVGDRPGGPAAPPGPAETDEHRLWRALRDAARLPDGAVPDAETMRSLAANLDVLQSYPPTLRHRLVPLVADTLLRGGALSDADRLLDRAREEPGLDLARAAALQAHGQNDAALAAYDRLVLSSDRSVRARAAVAALDLRVSLGRMTPAAAGDAGERLTYAWRGDARERDLRLRVANWRGRAGQFRQQLEGLRDALDVFPDPSDGIKQRLDAAFADIVRAPAAATVDRLTPLDLISLVQENADLLPDGAAGEAMVDRLADRLAALDLPQQASDVLGRLMRSTIAPATKAALGARLAALELGEGRAQPALDALDQSAPQPASGADATSASTLTASLVEQRALLLSRAHAALGQAPAALASLSSFSSSSALLARAQVHEDAHDWPHAASDLLSAAARSLPGAGPLNPDQSGVVLRLASALAQSGDEAGLAALRVRFTGRLTDRNDAALLAVLTEPPIRGVADLHRARAEIVAARGVPAALQATSHAD